jgi:hypothetical protein
MLALVAGRGHCGDGGHRHGVAGAPAAPPGTSRLRRGRQAALSSVAVAGLAAALIGLGAIALWELRRYPGVTVLVVTHDPAASDHPAEHHRRPRRCDQR